MLLLSSSSSSSLVTGLFSPVLLLNQRWSSPLRLQVSDCSPFRIMCDVPSAAVFVVNLSNDFLVRLTNMSFNHLLLFQWLQLLLVQFCISGITFVVSLLQVFYFFVFNYYIWPICRNLCVPLDSKTLLLLTWIYHKLNAQFYLFNNNITSWSSTCFEHRCAHLQEDNCIFAASGIVTLCMAAYRVWRYQIL
jgi:hypothetical protein